MATGMDLIIYTSGNITNNLFKNVPNISIQDNSITVHFDYVQSFSLSANKNVFSTFFPGVTGSDMNGAIVMDIGGVSRRVDIGAVVKASDADNVKDILKALRFIFESIASAIGGKIKVVVNDLGVSFDCVYMSGSFNYTAGEPNIIKVNLVFGIGTVLGL